MDILNTTIKYTTKEKYLGSYFTDDNNIKSSDLTERAANVIVKYRNFINNHKTTTLKIKLRVLQACFTSSIISNCETWGPHIPQKIYTLYNQGIKMALGIRNSTPTAIIYMESKQPYIKAIILKRQLTFWRKLNKGEDTELGKLIVKANKTTYIKHYMKLEEKYQDPRSLYENINNEHYENMWKIINTANSSKSKLHLYNIIYGKKSIPKSSLSLDSTTRFQQLLTRYITSSHNLESEIAKWRRVPKGQRFCKQCTEKEDDTIYHFLFKCEAFNEIREDMSYFPKDIHNFFKWEYCLIILNKMHSRRK